MAQSSSGVVTIRYVSLVLCITSHLHTIRHVEASWWRCSERRHCIFVRRLTPLQRRNGCVVFWTMTGAETRRVHRARGVGGGACNAPSLSWIMRQIFITILIITSWTLQKRLNRSRMGLVLFFSRPRSEIGYTMDVLSPFISVLCHSDWLFHGESCPRLDVVPSGRASSSSPACTWHYSLH